MHFPYDAVDFIMSVCDTANDCVIYHWQDIYWGFDFHKNGEVYKPVFGQYSTEIFTREAERILKEHDPSQVGWLFPFLNSVQLCN